MQRRDEHPRSGGNLWVSRWSLEAPFPLRIGDGGSLWVGETVELGSWMGVTVLMRIGDGSLRFGHGRFEIRPW